MNQSSLLTVLVVAAIVVCGVALWALVELVKTLRSTRRLSDDLSARLVPLLDKADITVDAINAELYRIDGIITRFEAAGERVDAASGTLTDIVNTPGELVSEFADKVRRAFKDRRRAAAGARESEAHGGSDRTADDEPTMTAEQTAVDDTEE